MKNTLQILVLASACVALGNCSHDRNRQVRGDSSHMAMDGTYVGMNNSHTSNDDSNYSYPDYNPPHPSTTPERGTNTLTVGSSGHTGATNIYAGTGKVVMSGAGILPLTGTNSDTGVTDLKAGTLIVNGTNPGTGLVAVAGGAALGGDGSVVGSATFSNGSSLFAWDLSVANPGDADSANTGDTFAVTGNLTDGDTVLKIVLGGSQTLGDTFWSESHNWSNVLTSPNLLARQSPFDSFDYANVSGLPIAVPEMTSAMIGLLLGALMLRRNRR